MAHPCSLEYHVANYQDRLRPGNGYGNIVLNPAIAESDEKIVAIKNGTCYGEDSPYHSEEVPSTIGDRDYFRQAACPSLSADNIHDEIAIGKKAKIK